jgi:hypothetical protein
MNRIFVLLLIFSTSALFLSSCNKDEESDNSFSYIILNYFEEFHPTGREFVFALETVEQYPCDNFLIKTEVNDSDHTLEIKAQSLDVSNICINVIGPATRVLNLKSPEEYHKRNVFWVNENQHEFHFNVTEEKIEVERRSKFGSNLIFPYDSILRIPDGYVWGYFVIRDKNDRDITAELLSAFYEKGVVEFTLADGNYHYFEIIDGRLRFEGMETEVKTFGFMYSGDLESITTIATETAPGIQIRIFDTLGNTVST